MAGTWEGPEEVLTGWERDVPSVLDGAVAESNAEVQELRDEADEYDLNVVLREGRGNEPTGLWKTVGNEGDVFDRVGAGRRDTITEGLAVGALVDGVLLTTGKTAEATVVTEEEEDTDPLGRRGSKGVRAPAALGIRRVRRGLLRTR
jgi:hypothetical protein